MNLARKDLYSLRLLIRVGMEALQKQLWSPFPIRVSAWVILYRCADCVLLYQTKQSKYTTCTTTYFATGLTRLLYVFEMVCFHL